MSLLAVGLSLLVACGGRQSQGRDAADAGGLDGASDHVTEPRVDGTVPPSDVPAESIDGSPADVSVDAADAPPDVPAESTDGSPADVSADGADAFADAPADAGPMCTLGTSGDCAACGDRACSLANTLTACMSADRCSRAVCTAGFANCNAALPDCEASFAGGGACLPRHRWTTPFPTRSLHWASTAVATDGSYFLSGAFTGTVDFDPTGAQDVHSAVGPADIAAFITKMNADGSYAWTRSFSEPGVGLGSVAAAPDGGVVAVGEFLWSIDLDPGPGVDLHQASTNPASGRQGLVVKLAADGSLVWGRTFFEAPSERPYSSGVATAVDATGAVYVGGMFTSTVDFDPGPGTAVRTAPLVGDAMLVKLTPAGDFSWVQTINNGDCHTQLNALTVATDGTVWGVGHTGMGPRCTGIPSPPGPEGVQPLIAAYSAGGAARGLSLLPPADGLAYGFAASAGANGSLYVGGRASGLIDLDPGAGVAMRWAGPAPSGFLAKLAPDVSLLWAVGVPGVVVNGLAATADGGVLAVGERNINVVNEGPTAVVTKLGADGTPGWTFTTGGPGGSADAVAAGPSSFVVAVSNQEAGDVDPGPGTQILDGALRFLSRFDF